MTWHDIGIADAPDSLKQEITEEMHSFFSSPGFAEYCEPVAAERLCYRQSADGAIAEAFCYYRCAGKRCVIFGPVDLSPSLILELPRTLSCREVVIIRMESIPPAIAAEPPWRVAVRTTSSDWIIRLPFDEDQYLMSLGAKTRFNLRKYLRRLQVEWGARFHVRVLEREEIGETEVETLLRLNTLRLAKKADKTLWSEELLHRRWQLSTRCGIFVGLYDSDRLVAGTLLYLHRKNAYGVLLGHDPSYDRLNLGTLALWMTINQFIRMRLEELHLLWGDSAYKQHLGASKVDLEELVVFASPARALRWHLADRSNSLRLHARRRVRRIRWGIARRIARPSAQEKQLPASPDGTG